MARRRPLLGGRADADDGQWHPPGKHPSSGPAALRTVVLLLEVMVMVVLVAYATDHGSTRGVAVRIADRLRQRGVDAKACAVADVLEVSNCEAVVLGSAIHGGKWLPEATVTARKAPVALAGLVVIVALPLIIGVWTGLFGIGQRWIMHLFGG